MQKTITVKFQSLEQIRTFCDILNQCQGNFELESGRYRINARSIMGICTLDLSMPVLLHMTGGSDVLKEASKKLGDYLWEE